MVLLVFLLVALPLLARIPRMAKLVAHGLGLRYLEEVALIFVEAGLGECMVLGQCGHGEGVV